MPTRRHFLAQSACSALALAYSSRTLASVEPTEWRNRPSEMNDRRLGRTGFMVSRIVMGGNPISPNHYEHILPALDRGLNDGHWNLLQKAPFGGPILTATVSNRGNAQPIEGYLPLVKQR